MSDKELVRAEVLHREPSAFVSELMIPASPEWDGCIDKESGILRVRRFCLKSTPLAWCVLDVYEHFLSREVFKWRVSHPCEPLVLPVDLWAKASAGRKAAADLFHYYPAKLHSAEEDKSYAFSFAEALALCGITTSPAPFPEPASVDADRFAAAR